MSEISQTPEPELRKRETLQVTKSSIFKRLSLQSTSTEEEISFLYFQNKSLFERFEKKEVLRIHTCFQTLCEKDKVLSPKEFVKSLGMFDLAYEFILKGFEKSKLRAIDEASFSVFVASLQRGETDERAKIIFNIFDQEKKNKVTKETLESSLQSIFSTLEQIGLLQVDLKKYVQILFDTLDNDKKGYFTLDDYKRVIEKEPLILISLGQYPKQSYDTNHKFRPPGRVLSFGEKFWNLGLQMMFGIRQCSLIRSELKTIYKGDFTTSIEMSIQNQESDKEKESIQFASKAPNVFLKLRAAFGVSEFDYGMSLGPEQVLGNLLAGRLTTLSEKVSDGKSGSFFFFSHDGKFMAKTISKSEGNAFKNLLPHYYKYMIENPDTSLVRIYGWHEIDDQQFVVMGNVFQTTLSFNEVYDLKGSTVGRTNKNGFVKKDNDIKKERFKFDKQQKQKLMDTLKKDTEFLKKNNIIDYSFLIGTHEFKGLDSKSITILSNCTSLKSTSFTITDNEIYFYGIIDIFTLYDMKKSAEHNFKSIVYSSTGISAVPSSQYQERFMKFVEQCIQNQSE